MKAGYNQDADNVVQQTACSSLGGWSHGRFWSTSDAED